MKRYLMLAAASLAAITAAGVAATSASAVSYTTQCQDLIAGKGGPVAGTVCVTQTSPTSLQVVFTTSGYVMTEAHLAVATSPTAIPQANGNPIPGQFPYTYVDAGGFTSHTFDVTGLTAPGNYTIAAHAKVWSNASATTVPLVSDAATQVTSFMGTAEGPNAAVPAYEPVGYPDCGQYQLSPATGSVWDTQNGGSASNDTGGPFDGATWIWRTSNPVFPDAGEYATFVKTFNLPGPPTTGSILVTADNGYQASLNGGVLGTARLYQPFFDTGDLTEAGVNTTGWQTPDSYNLPLQMGSNTLSIIAANEQAYPDYPNQQTTGVGGTAGGVCPNPGGLIFKGSASYLAQSNTAWGAGLGSSNFSGKNWGTYFTFTLV